MTPFKYFILVSISILICSCSTTSNVTKPLKNNNLFKHGVASFDPTESRVIIWSKIENSTKADQKVKWFLYKDEQGTMLVQQGELKAKYDDNFSFHVDLDGLERGKDYYYQFEHKKQRSVIGRTNTLGGFPAQVNIGIISCSNYEWGYFNGYKSLAEKDLDFVLHLGDYIYEYGPGTYGDTTLARKHVPAKEIITLQDYRTRYSQYRMDPDLQLAHQKHPFVTIWDDHEITNNAYIAGAQNHQEGEGSYEQRKAIAKKVYFEWLPVRHATGDQLYRSFSSDNLADFIMLDERLAGRTEPAGDVKDLSADQLMLGSNQLNWFNNELKNSDAEWKIIGNQVIFSPLDVGRVWGTPLNLDAWDGYPTERNEIINTIADNEIKNVIFATGDTHSSWIFDVPADIKQYVKTKERIAVELGTPSISSGNWNDGGASTSDVIFNEKVLENVNPHLQYVNGRDHGYILLTLKKSSAIAEFIYVSNLKSRKFTEKVGKKIVIDKL